MILIGLPNAQKLPKAANSMAENVVAGPAVEFDFQLSKTQAGSARLRNSGSSSSFAHIATSRISYWHVQKKISR